TVDVTSDEYNELVLQLTKLNELKSSLEEKISILDDRIDRLENSTATDEQVAKAQTYVTKAVENATGVYDIVYNHSEELFESNAYLNQYMNSITTIESESIKGSLKSFGIGAAAGLLIGLVAWVADAFILEFKDAAKRQNETKEELK
nr:hypothetical protein [Clostridia bacterium]